MVSEDTRRRKGHPHRFDPCPRSNECQGRMGKGFKRTANVEWLVPRTDSLPLDKTGNIMLATGGLGGLGSAVVHKGETEKVA